jgi:hypothetical protein
VNDFLPDRVFQINVGLGGVLGGVNTCVFNWDVKLNVRRVMCHRNIQNNRVRRQTIILSVGYVIVRRTW